MQGNRSRALLALFFIVAGCLHFVFPANYMRVMPPWLPAHLSLVLVSGGFEILGGKTKCKHPATMKNKASNARERFPCI